MEHIEQESTEKGCASSAELGLGKSTKNQIFSDSVLINFHIYDATWHCLANQKLGEDNKNNRFRSPQS